MFEMAAEEAARDLIRELPTAELTSEESELLDRACRLGELWAMNVTAVEFAGGTAR